MHVAAAWGLKLLAQHGSYMRQSGDGVGVDTEEAAGGTCWRDAATTGKTVPAAPGSIQHAASHHTAARPRAL